MKAHRSRLAPLSWSAPAWLLATAACASDITLPPENAKLRASSLPGYAVAAQKCGICHSADYVDYQPPGMTQTQWTAEMTKMQRAYGAPLSDDEVKLLGIYLAATYGDAKGVTDAQAPKPSAAAPASAAKQDVQSLLTANGCLACHAADRKIVGPAYHDVAVKFKPDPEALAHVVASIRQGSAGKWGTTPMPPFADLKADDAKALAEYVLEQ